MKNLYKLIIFNLFAIFAIIAIFEFIFYKENIKQHFDFNETCRFLYPYKTNPKLNFINNYKKVEYNKINEIESGFRPIYNILQNSNGGG